MNLVLEKNISDAAKIIGNTWPLYSFVTSNPLKGLEDHSFESSVGEAGKLLNAAVYPEKEVFAQALELGEIDRQLLSEMLVTNGFPANIEESLKQMASRKGENRTNTTHGIDRILVKWLAAFLDEGLAEWEMPHKTEGFYQSWRSLAVYDTEIDVPSLKDLPKTGGEALEYLLESYPVHEHNVIFKYHFAALPGWVGYIKHRCENDTLWQQNFPISLKDYLAVRLTIAKLLKFEILPPANYKEKAQESLKLQYIWLQAWEKSFQNELKRSLTINDKPSQTNDVLPEAQLVFCIDTRSELLRRHIEMQGNYETFGFAGFFGIAMDYTNPSNGLTKKSCPPIVNSAYKVEEQALLNSTERMVRYLKNEETKKFGNYFLTRMKNMLPSAFGFVEASGVFYGLSMVSRTIFPGLMYRFKKTNSSGYESFTKPVAHCIPHHEEKIPLEDKIGIVKSAIEVMGIAYFAPLIVIAGHGSHSANNAFGSGLDCGACAASPGRHNARLFVELANLPAVRLGLKQRYEIEIPDSSIFIAAEHNTTTDEIILFDSEVAHTHQAKLKKLKASLANAQRGAVEDRSITEGTTIAATHKKANSWAETRPEWGLAKNAGFIVGPRALTKGVNLNSRCFLQSYNWELDKDGTALEGIMQGPMVVTQWINNHYYFATVDNEKFGGGNKISHNVTGKFGVVQGNGGDLKIGLPLQSVKETDDKMYHQPLRLSVLIQAPIKNIQYILNKNANLKTLLDNQWIYLMIMDPMHNNEISLYESGMSWTSSNDSIKYSKMEK
ncbi:MAG: DUF2309 domain-containing protein [Pedobacter sp.]|nr:DUF2309 domain-containing protein [Pedobacter sp.]